MPDYSSLYSSINSAVENYENYKSQSISSRLNNVSLESTGESNVGKNHSKRASMAMPIMKRFGSSDGKEKTSSPRESQVLSTRRHTLQPPTNVPGNDDSRSSSPSHGSYSDNSAFRDFIAIAENYEACNFLYDLDFLQTVLDFMQNEHPYTTNSLQKAIKARHATKRKLWVVYTNEMQGLARAFSSNKPVPIPSASSPLSPTNIGSTRSAIRDAKARLKETIARIDNSERTCAESILSALSHLHAQAIKDICIRYSMPDPINDKITSVEKHNERVRVFNQLIKFVADDLRRLDIIMKASASANLADKKKDKKGPGVVEAVESLQVDDYPPYGSK